MLIALSALALALTVGAPADVTGKWQGTLTSTRSDGSTAEDTALVILEQRGSKLSGTVGSNENDRHPITSGSIDGNKISLQAKNANNEREYTIELTVEGDAMKGSLTSGDRSATLALKRVKP
jgi:hypothetical protein